MVQTSVNNEFVGRLIFNKKMIAKEDPV